MISFFCLSPNYPTILFNHCAGLKGLQGLSGRKAGNMKEVLLGWINGGRKKIDGFRWGKIRWW